MNLLEVKNELSINSKNGISFLLAGAIIWMIITFIFLQPIEMREKNIFMLYSTGLTFPLSIIISKMLKADWKNKENPLSNLALYFNLAQLIYFPILFWAFFKDPTEMVIFFAIITGAHFFPYSWLYNTKVFYFFAPFISLLIFFMGLTFASDKLWITPLTMVISIIFLNLFLYIDYRKKVNVKVNLKN